MKDVFIIDTSPFPSESGHFADMILPDHTYLERYQDAPTYPFEGFPMTQLRVPAVEPIHDTKYFGDTLIEIGKRMNGPDGRVLPALDSAENVLRHLAKGFETDPGDNGVDGWESWVEKGVWYKKPYLWQQRDGVFYEWDGHRLCREMRREEVQEAAQDPSGKFEFRLGARDECRLDRRGHRARPVQPHVPDLGAAGASGRWRSLLRHAEGGAACRRSRPQHPDGHRASAAHVGGRGEAFVEINPVTARERGIADGDRVRISSDVGTIEARCRSMKACGPTRWCCRWNTATGPRALVEGGADRTLRRGDGEPVRPGHRAMHVLLDQGPRGEGLREEEHAEMGNGHRP
jgi:thiosulfate reductase / polysulfide reductase chain A